MGPFLDIYKNYKAFNRRIAQGEKIYFGQRGSGCSFSTVYRANDRVLGYPKIGIYTGIGTSHSWLWFVDLFDRMGFYELSFLNEDEIQRDGLDGLDVLVMSGGDTFAMAEGLGASGASDTTGLLRKIRTDAGKGSGTVNLANEIFNNLKRMSMICLDFYFKTAVTRFTG